MPASDSITSVEKLFLLFRSCQKIDALLRFFFPLSSSSFFLLPLSLFPPLSSRPIEARASKPIQSRHTRNHAVRYRQIITFHARVPWYPPVLIHPTTFRNVSTTLPQFLCATVTRLHSSRKIAVTTRRITTIRIEPPSPRCIHLLWNTSVVRFVNQWIKREWGGVSRCVVSFLFLFFEIEQFWKLFYRESGGQKRRRKVWEISNNFMYIITLKNIVKIT